MQNQNVDMKIVLLGSSYVGKTCLVDRFINDRFDSSTQQTVGAAFLTKIINTNDNKLVLGIWDTAGQERFESMSKMYYRKANAAIICYDVTDYDSFKKLQYWVDEVRENEKNCVIYFCGTKIDLLEDESDRTVPMEEIEKYADKMQITLFETSSKLNKNVNNLFLKISHNFIKKKNQKLNSKKMGNKNSTINIKNGKNQPNDEKGICC
ncbi:ras-related protein rab-24 [Anaeramoeba flamelloides]|nr:ras-related protein rab-24 [Anaeramoeba flamelloides]